ncbi:uncharacterized protein VICG_01035, partial [Vittaforma corneae ATCC 50505]
MATEKQLSNFSAIASIVAATLGCGITLMPSVYLYLGSLIATILMLSVGLLTFFSIYSLSYVAIEVRKKVALPRITIEMAETVPMQSEEIDHVQPEPEEVLGKKLSY